MIKVVARFIKWCYATGCRHEPNLYHNAARFILGHNGTHDLYLIRQKRFIKIVITRQSRGDSIPSPGVEARRFLEATLEELSTETPWLHHMRYELAVLCPSCVAPDKQCFKHKQNGCFDDECLHLLGFRYGEPLICTKSYGDSSRVDNINVEAWFTNPPHEEKDESETKSEVAETSAVATGPPVFISYQWDLKEDVKKLKTRLENAGIRCWMDNNQMGGGDALNAKIDAGITASKVVIACVTEKYCGSENCQCEVALARCRKKFIIPLLFEKVNWPPEGSLAMPFAQLLYIDMTGLWDPDKFDELLKQIKQHLPK